MQTRTPNSESATKNSSSRPQAKAISEAQEKQDEEARVKSEKLVAKAPEPEHRQTQPKQPGAKAKQWREKVEKLHLGSLDEPDLTVVAQYNPKELQIDKDINWHIPEQVSGSNPETSPQDQGEVTTNPTRTAHVELLFDGFEEMRSVQPDIDLLEKLSSVREPGSRLAHLRRAHHCVLVWGSIGGAKKFRCVITSLAVKVMMVSPEGDPLRATCTVKLKEVTRLARTSGEAT